jgi:phosphatidylinositol-bisphosphatase
MLVYVRKEISTRITGLATASVGVGLGGWAANKGAVGVRFDVDNVLPICFVVSHLSAFDTIEARERRRWDYTEIVKRLQFYLVEHDSDDDDDEGNGNAEHKEAFGPERDAIASLRAQLNKESLWSVDDVGNSTLGSAADDTSQQLRQRRVAIMDHEVVFWAGDLNFRLELSLGEVKHLIQKRQFESALLKYDQLRNEIQAKSSFDGFQEQQIK